MRPLALNRFVWLSAFCLFNSVPLARADDWPQWQGKDRDDVWHETGIVETFPKEGPPIKWRTPIGAGYSGPAVAMGKVFITDRKLAPGASNPKNPFQAGVIPGEERVLCLDIASGKILWEHSYDCPYTMSYAAGPRATPVVSGKKAYTLGAEGNLLCLDTDKGNVEWSHDFKKEYGIRTPTWGFASSPLVDGDRLISLVGGSNSTVVAFDKSTGQELWRALSSKEPGYSPPVIISEGGKRQLIVWHPESVNSLNPETGEIYWTAACPARQGMAIATPRKLGDLLYLTCFYNGSYALRLDETKPGATLVWKSKKVSEMDTDALHCTMSTPYLEDGYIYGTCSYGQLRCLKADTGERVWESLAATTYDGKPVRWGNAFITKNAGRFLVFNEKGDLISAKLSPAGYEEISRAHLLEPTNKDPGRAVVWSHPAYSDARIYARNDAEIICADLSAAR